MTDVRSVDDLETLVEEYVEITDKINSSKKAAAPEDRQRQNALATAIQRIRNVHRSLQLDDPATNKAKRDGTYVEESGVTVATADPDSVAASAREALAALNGDEN